MYDLAVIAYCLKALSKNTEILLNNVSRADTIGLPGGGGESGIYGFLVKGIRPGPSGFDHQKISQVGINNALTKPIFNQLLYFFPQNPIWDPPLGDGIHCYHLAGF